MLSIFVEASCTRYSKDECLYCHVEEPLMKLPTSDWHMTLDQAQAMADKIKQVDVIYQLAQHEINLTGGEASQNPDIVEIAKIFKTVTPNICLHTNLDITSQNTKRFKRLVEIAQLGGRIDITLYPKIWEKVQKGLLREILNHQNRLLVNIVFESLENLKDQIGMLVEFFQELGTPYAPVLDLIEEYQKKVAHLVEHFPKCDEAIYTQHMGETGSFSHSENFIFGLNLLPAFNMDERGHRAMASNPFQKDKYLLHCVAARGAIEIMTVEMNGDMTPCCDVGNLKCSPKFGNLLEDSPERILERFESSRKVIEQGIAKNRQNMQDNRSGEWVEEGIPPYCM